MIVHCGDQVAGQEVLAAEPILLVAAAGRRPELIGVTELIVRSMNTMALAR